jgi:flagellin-like hook-associated protein FlgL
MGVASSAMGSMNEILHRMRELAVQAANDTNTGPDRQYIQQEVDQLSRQMLSIINTQFKGDYIFNGTQSKVPPYEIKASASERVDYLQSTMAAYGRAADGTSVIKDFNDPTDPNDLDNYVYLDYHNQPLLSVGDKIQMKWSNTNNATVDPDNDPKAGNFLPDTLSDGAGGARVMDTIEVGGETFRRYNGIDDPEDPNYISDPDYAIDYLTGEVTVLSARFRDALNVAAFNPAAPVVAVPSFNSGDLPPNVNIKFGTTNTVQMITGNSGAPIEDLFPG